MKGMNRVSRGSGFKGVVSYVLAADREGGAGRLIGGNLAACTSADPKAIAQEFRDVANQCPKIKKPVWHFAVRAKPGEKISDEKYSAIGEAILDRAGLSGHQYIVVRHDDENAVHIISNRVSPSGKIYYGQNENLKLTKIIGQLEKDFGLIQTKQAESNARRDVSRPSKRALDFHARTGTLPDLQKIQADVLASLDAAGGDDLEFARLLAEREIGLKFRVVDSEIQGVSYIYKGRSVSGSKLGNAFTLPGLLRAGLKINPRNFGAESINTSSVRRLEIGGLSGYGKTKPGSWQKFWLDQAAAAANTLPDLIIRADEQKILCYSQDDSAIEAMIREAEQRFEKYDFFGSADFIARCEVVQERLLKNEQIRKATATATTAAVTELAGTSKKSENNDPARIRGSVQAGRAVTKENTGGGEAIAKANQFFKSNNSQENNPPIIANNNTIRNTVNPDIDFYKEINMDKIDLQNAVPQKWKDYLTKTGAFLANGGLGMVIAEPQARAWPDEAARNKAIDKIIFVDSLQDQVALRTLHPSALITFPPALLESHPELQQVSGSLRDALTHALANRKPVYNFTRAQIRIPGAVPYHTQPGAGSWAQEVVNRKDEPRSASNVPHNEISCPPQDPSGNDHQPGSDGYDDGQNGYSY